MCTCTCNLCTSCLWLICTCTCTLYVQRTMYVHSIILCCTMYIVRCIYIMYNVQCKMHVQCTAMFNKCKVCVECGVRYYTVVSRYTKACNLTLKILLLLFCEIDRLHFEYFIFAINFHTKVLLHHRFQFSLCWNHFSIATVFFE